MLVLIHIILRWCELEAAVCCAFPFLPFPVFSCGLCVGGYLLGFPKNNASLVGRT
jgi:hypothetical protein